MKLLQERKSHALILIVTLESLMPEDMDVIILNQEGVVLNVELIGVMSVVVIFVHVVVHSKGQPFVV